jgi:C-terminal processing protease CtpA/Prc
MLPVTLLAGAQNYDLEKLKTLSTIWGETYLFHPSIIRADKSIEWEKQLVEFLPKTKKNQTTDEFIQLINSELLSVLDDPFTLVQNKGESYISKDIIKSGNSFDYIRLSEDQLADISSLADLNSMIQDRTSDKALLVDVRIQNPLETDRHSNTLFEYFTSMFIDKEMVLSSSVSREHYGWDEYNDWWFYEQRWKLASIDKHISNSGTLMPFKSYSQDLEQFLPEIDFGSFAPVQRPLYFVTNNSFLSYYYSLLISLQTQRENTLVINEDAGRIYSDNPGLKKYSFGDFEFVLNTSFYLNQGRTELFYALNTASLSQAQITQCINAGPVDKLTSKDFVFGISPAKYISPGTSLSQEEKILGIIKIWTLVKYFYAYPDHISIDWENSLEKHLQLSLNTSSDKEYFTLVQKIMSTLNDSHVSTYHPSILDFSMLFIAPINFKWIEEKVLITDIDSTLKIDAAIGDEIVGLNGFSINELFENEKTKISSSNRQAFITNLINPGYFTGAPGSLMKLRIKKNTGIIDIEVPRTSFIFQYLGSDDQREASKIYEDNIGYLNLASLNNPADLEQELLKMEKTSALILDLRSSYPTHSYDQFLRMLCSSENTKLRMDEVPVLSSNHQHSKQIQINDYIIDPDTTFSYTNPLAVLIDKTMISRPEDIAICLRAFPNITFIGEQTQGTDGEMTLIHLPGGGETSFTGQRIKFGNGDSFQRIGIMPDIKVEETRKGLLENRDEILEKAKEFCLERISDGKVKQGI